ncbi:hypothetical protein ET495_13285 [Xylanimonas allomyrinae]|uniref:Uncharacterized protein n=1 Tax=Xylanimonas allomyrinae TaxID=2509459 RepID=A0A4P6ENG7_9MICO|nr:hypothetical protein [Xylanimonas allomyrinae]QAY64035.1 hypothetical protein ET495_13285 [Xylanimonas allomyrinae]
MSEFQVAKRVKQEPTVAVAARVLLSFVLFLGGLVLVGVGTSDGGAVPWLWVVLGILAVALAFGLPMRGASER